jgi:dihydrofolate synthase / folylpolyglutamate synthase
VNYQETLDYLYNSLPTYHRIGDSALKPTLDNTLALCKPLGDPQKKFKSIHIAGTNGKGSTSHMLAAILQQCGYKTGLFTSPHLKSFTERIRINGKEIDVQQVVDYVEGNKIYFDKIKPSFFEMTTALAFGVFAKENIDIAVVEVGLGGRFDSTNIITPLLSLITNISLDHQKILGDTLPQIAFEKAGIIKSKVPVIISEYQEEVIRVFKDKAEKESARLVVGSDKYQLVNVSSEKGRLKSDVYFGKELRLKEIETDLSGLYQLKNIPGVLAAVDELRNQGFILPDEKIKDALLQVVKLTGLKGRWQKLNDEPLIICDTAHNEAGMMNVVEQLKLLRFKQLHFVFGTVNDKDIQKVLSILPKDAFYYFCQPNIPRALDAFILFSNAQSFGLVGEVVPSVHDAIKKAKDNASSEDMIFIGGSNFVVAEIENL